MTMNDIFLKVSRSGIGEERCIELVGKNEKQMKQGRRSVRAELKNLAPQGNETMSSYIGEGE